MLCGVATRKGELCSQFSPGGRPGERLVTPGCSHLQLGSGVGKSVPLVEAVAITPNATMQDSIRASL